jgi:ERCC4-related helicase
MGVFHDKDPEKVSKFMLLQAKNRMVASGQARGPQHSMCMHDFALATAFTHALELLECHGATACYAYLNNLATGNKGMAIAKAEMASQPELVRLGSILQAVSKRSGGESLSQLVCGNPKLASLASLLAQHFAGDHSTRAIVFSQFRDSVMEIVHALQLQRPGVRATPFVGQSSARGAGRGLTQRQQAEVVEQVSVHCTCAPCYLCGHSF